MSPRKVVVKTKDLDRWKVLVWDFLILNELKTYKTAMGRLCLRKDILSFWSYVY